MINLDKTNLMIVAKPAMKNQTEELRIIMQKGDIYPKKQIRIPGCERNTQGSKDTHMDLMTQQVRNMMARMMEMKSFMT